MGKFSRLWATYPAIAGMALLITAVSWAYYPTVTHSYGYNDDYHLLKSVAEGSFELSWQKCMDGGRPLYRATVKAFYSLAESIDDLGRVRLLGLLGILTFALTAFRLLRRAGHDVAFSTAAAAVVSLTPGFGVFAAWGTLSCVGYVGACSLIAGELIWRAVGETRRAARILQALAGSMLLILVCATYQPLYAFSVFSILALAWGQAAMDATRARKFLLAVSLVFVAACAYVVSVKIAWAMTSVGEQSQRAAFPTDILGKARFIVVDVLGSGFTGWAQFYNLGAQRIAGSVVAAICLGSCLRSAPGKLRLSPWSMACAALAVFMTVLPIAAVGEDIFAFRTQAALHGTIALVFFIGLQRLIGRSTPAVRIRLVSGCLYAGTVATFTFMAHAHILRDFIEPNEREVRILSQAIRNLGEFPSAVVYIPPAQPTRKSDSVAEYRQISSPLRWVTTSMLELLFVRVYDAHVPLRVALNRHTAFSVQASPTTGSATPVINGFELLHGESPTVEHHPYWGRLRVNENGWAVSDWFGVFDNRTFPWIFHSELGWLFCSGAGVTEFSFWCGQLGWFHTEPGRFPDVFVKDRNSWARFSRSVHPGVATFE